MKKIHWSDDDIKALFLEMKEGDIEQVPSFEETWAAAKVKVLKKKKTRMWFRVAASIAFLVATGTILYISHQAQQDNHNPVETPYFHEEITVWESPTSNLLPTNKNANIFSRLLQTNSENERPRNISLIQWKSPTGFLLNPHVKTKNELLTN